ncbi:MAG: hypothetical protein ACPG1C_12615 [Alphaproteobacteria bacterium]
MALIHKFAASILLAAFLVAGPLGQCASALAVGPMPIVQLESEAAHHGHIAQGPMEKSAQNHDDLKACLDHCRGTALEQAVLAAVDQVAAPSFVDHPEFALAEIAAIPTLKHVRDMFRPPPQRWQAAPQTLVTLHTQLRA